MDTRVLEALVSDRWGQIVGFDQKKKTISLYASDFSLYLSNSFMVLQIILCFWCYWFMTDPGMNNSPGSVTMRALLIVILGSIVKEYNAVACRLAAPHPIPQTKIIFDLPCQFSLNSTIVYKHNWVHALGLEVNRLRPIPICEMNFLVWCVGGSVKKNSSWFFQFVRLPTLAFGKQRRSISGWRTMLCWIGLAV